MFHGQEKYNLKAKQNAELQRMFRELQEKNGMRQGNGNGREQHQQFGMLSPSRTTSNHSGGHLVSHQVIIIMVTL